MGLGKPRSKLGKFLDRNGIKQKDIEGWTGISRVQIGKLCDGKARDIDPRKDTMYKVISALRKRGYDVDSSDFWAL